MLIELDLPFADVRAGDLALSLEQPVLPALETVSATLNGMPVELRLLGCSHQALAPDLSETVACVPGATGGLPATTSLTLAGGLAYAFDANVETLAPARYAQEARLAMAAAAEDPLGLVGVFPGPKDAFTALRLAPTERGVRWTTWHGYPQSGELVTTRTTLEPAR